MHGRQPGPPRVATRMEVSRGEAKPAAASLAETDELKVRDDAWLAGLTRSSTFAENAEQSGAGAA